MGADRDAIVAYHGTTAEFDRFDLSQEGCRAGVGGGLFFTSSLEVARDVYAWQPGSRVLCVLVQLDRPLRYEEYFDLSGLDRVQETRGGFDSPVNYYDDNWQAIVEFAKSNGFDGIQWPADPDSDVPHDLIVVFDPDKATILSVVERDLPRSDSLR